MAQFASSSQSKRWTYSSEQLDQCKRSHLQSLPSVSAEDVEYLLRGEEAAMQYFSQQIWIIFGEIEGSKSIIKRKWRVPASAIVYLRRFYTKQSMMTYDPRLVMLGAIYLAGKTEENFILLRDVLRISDKYAEDKILGIERTLLETLDFDLKIHHPQNEMHGLVTGFRTFLSSENIHVEGISTIVKEWIVAADKILRELQLTKVVLCCKPLHMAIFALKASAPVQLDNHFDAYIRQQQLGNLEVIDAEIPSIVQAVSEAAPMPEFMKYLKSNSSWSGAKTAMEM